jgi:hypothetical protein
VTRTMLACGFLAGPLYMAGRGAVDMVALGSDGLAGGGLSCEVQATSRPAAKEATATPARTL